MDTPNGPRDVTTVKGCHEPACMQKNGIVPGSMNFRPVGEGVPDITVEFKRRAAVAATENFHMKPSQIYELVDNEIQKEYPQGCCMPQSRQVSQNIVYATIVYATRLCSNILFHQVLALIRRVKNGICGDDPIQTIEVKYHRKKEQKDAILRFNIAFVSDGKPQRIIGFGVTCLIALLKQNRVR